MKSIRANIRNQVLHISFSGDLELKYLEDAKELIEKRINKSFKKAIVTVERCHGIDMAFMQFLVGLIRQLKTKVGIETNLRFGEKDQAMLDKVGFTRVLNNLSKL